MEVLLAACCVGAMHPSLLWRDDYFDLARAVVADGNTAYVSGFASGVVVADVSNPASPTLLGLCNTRGRADGMALSGQLLYVADYDKGLAICDVSNPSSPVVVGTFDCPPGRSCQCYNVDVVGTMVYLGDENRKQVYIVDAADPKSPRLLGTYTIQSGSRVKQLQVSGSYMYVAINVGLEIVDISDPALPALAGFLDGIASAQGIVVSGTVAYVGGTAVSAVDVSDPRSPVLKGSADAGGYINDLALDGTTLYAGCLSCGLIVFDVSNTASPSETGRLTKSVPHGVSFTGKTVVVASYSGSSFLETVDVSTPAMPALLGEYGKTGRAGSVRVSGGIAVVCDYFIRIYDVSNPSAGKYVSTLNLRTHAFRSFIVGTLVYVGTGNGLSIVDITDPSSPSIVGKVDIGREEARGVWVEGQTAYIAAGGPMKLYTIDVSDPTTPTVVGRYTSPAPGNANDLTVVGTTAYVAASQLGLVLIDVSKPTSPSLLGSYVASGNVRGVSVMGTVAYVATFFKMEIVDISNPAAPSLLGDYRLVGLQGVFSVGQTVYAHGDGVSIMSTADPTSPVLLDVLESDGNAADVFVVGTTVYVADQGLRIFGELVPTPETPAPTPVPTPAPVAHYAFGCFKHNTRFLTRVYAGDSNTGASCAARCAAGGYAWAGTEFGRECWCGQSVRMAQQTASSECDRRCAGNGGEACGGVHRLSLYSLSAARVPTTAAKVGCFVTSGPVRTLGHHGYSSNTGNTVEECAAVCAWNGFKYAGLEYGRQCWCGDALPAERTVPSQCNRECTGNAQQTCGGGWRASVYEVQGAGWRAPEHTLRGCFVDGSPRALPHRYSDRDKMTVEECAAICSHRGMPLAGLQHRRECWCGSSISAPAAAPGDCSLPCSGDATQVCGGSWRLSVYDVAVPAPAR